MHSRQDHARRQKFSVHRDHAVESDVKEMLRPNLARTVVLRPIFANPWPVKYFAGDVLLTLDQFSQSRTGAAKKNDTLKEKVTFIFVFNYLLVSDSS